MEKTKESKEVKELKKKLSSSNREEILDGIKMSREHANQDSFKLMLDCLKDTDEPEVEAAIINFLYDLKDINSAGVLIDAIKNPEMAYYHSFLIAAFWQSSLDGSEHLELFVKKAIEGEYMTTLESLTVIENFDSSFPNQLLMECEADLAEAIENEANEEKKNLLESLKEVVGKLPEEGE